MNIRKIVAPTARQALLEIRNQLGSEAVILSNRNTDEGVEIIAMANESIMQLTDRAQEARPKASPAKPRAPAVKGQLPGSAVRQQSAGIAQLAAISKPQAEAAREKIAPVRAPGVTAESSILGEIKSMRSILQQQLAAMSWTNVQQLDPQRAGLLRGMLNSGFSARLAGKLLNKMPAGSAHGESWIKQVLKHNLLSAGESDDIVQKGGVYALIGPTGVGKTTTTAKLAARAVVRYGADKVALLTTDSYRIGAYDQLKIYGKILGVAVHAVKDAEDLRMALSSLRNKHLVLIDTMGMGQRDERVGDQNEMFDKIGIKRLLLLNATSSGETLEDVVRMYRGERAIGCILTKLDEAAALGAVLDVAVRHRLVLRYVANGQRVPEDLHPANLDYLLHRALKAKEEESPFALHELEFPVMMAGEAAHAH
ncbi:MAG: flagellar biosynthesis protein FlhF [Nitrosomonadales bacterium]|nr:flagellar biosynthesis protein FlhF [Nitrosomonadales bacterium]